MVDPLVPFHERMLPVLHMDDAATRQIEGSATIWELMAHSLHCAVDRE
jgi:hypothetical protein